MALRWIIPNWVVRLLRSVEGLTVQVIDGQSILSISVNGGAEQFFRVRYFPVLSKEAAEKLHEFDIMTDASRLLVAAPKLAPSTRHLLRGKGISSIECETGVCRIIAPGILVDTTLKDTGRQADSEPGRAKLIDRSGLIAEVILSNFLNQELRLSGVASRAHASSGLVSRIFARLTAMKILEQNGSGPNTYWRLINPGALLETWSAEERQPERISSLYVYGRSPADLLVKLSQLGQLKVQWALSGVSAANLHAPTLNTTPDPTIWIDANQPVSEVASLLNGEIVEKGSNLQVWQSAGNFALQNIAPWLPKGGSNIPVPPGNLNIVSEPRAYIETVSQPGRAPEVAQNIRERLLKLHG